MRKYLLIVMLTFFAFAASAQKMTIRTCSIQYGDVQNFNLDDVIMDGDPCPYVSKFQLTKDYFYEIIDDKKYKFTYTSSSDVGFKTTRDFRITLNDKLYDKYEVVYSYKNQTLTFYYDDGEDNLRLTRFTIDHIKVK
jgi:hypothetical protein